MFVVLIFVVLALLPNISRAQDDSRLVHETVKATRVREVNTEFGNDDESKKMRDFFNRDNAYTLQRLQKRFAP